MFLRTVTNAVAVCDLSGPVMRGSDGCVFWDFGEQPLDGCQHISSRMMADSAAAVRPGKIAETTGIGKYSR